MAFQIQLLPAKRQKGIEREGKTNFAMDHLEVLIPSEKHI